MASNCSVDKDDVVKFILGIVASEIVGCILEETGITKLQIYKHLYPILYIYGIYTLAETFVKWFC